jgi:hypothetical protein
MAVNIGFENSRRKSKQLWPMATTRRLLHLLFLHYLWRFQLLMSQKTQEATVAENLEPLKPKDLGINDVEFYEVEQTPSAGFLGHMKGFLGHLLNDVQEAFDR